MVFRIFFECAPDIVRVKTFCMFAAGSGTPTINVDGGHIQPHKNMAIIQSLAIGSAVKSAGNLTYKRTRGRTIASQRITENKSNSSGQAGQRGVFAMQARMAKSIATWIDQSFAKTKFGSQRNNFISSAKSALQAFIRVDQVGQGLPDLIQASYKANELGKLFLAGKGEYTLQADYPTSITNALSVPVILSRNFAVGDTVKVMVAQVYTLASFPDLLLESVRTLGATLDASNVPTGGTLTVGTALIPELSNLSGLLPAGAATVSQIFSITVESADKKLCNTTFSAIKWGVQEWSVLSGTNAETDATFTLDRTLPIGYEGGTFTWMGLSGFVIAGAGSNIMNVDFPAGKTAVSGTYNHAVKVGPILVSKTGLPDFELVGVGSLEFMA